MASCGPSLGGDTAGGRGSFNVIFINNTTGRAVFTFGTYDDADPTSAPDFKQFGLDAGGRTLDADTQSTAIKLTCAHVFSIGAPLLLQDIAANRPDAQVDQAAFIDGAEFFDVSGDAPTSQGKAPPFEALLGTDFPCNSLLVIYLEANDGGSSPVRVDFQVFPSASSR